MGTVDKTIITNAFHAASKYLNYLFSQLDFLGTVLTQELKEKGDEKTYYLIIELRAVFPITELVVRQNSQKRA